MSIQQSDIDRLARLQAQLHHAGARLAAIHNQLVEAGRTVVEAHYLIKEVVDRANQAALSESGGADSEGEERALQPD